MSWTKQAGRFLQSSLKDVLSLSGYCKTSFEKWDIDWQIKGTWAVALNKVSTSLVPLPLISSSILTALIQIFIMKKFSQLGMHAIRTKLSYVSALLRNTRDSKFKFAIEESNLWKILKSISPNFRWLLRIIYWLLLHVFQLSKCEALCFHTFPKKNTRFLFKLQCQVTFHKVLVSRKVKKKSIMMINTDSNKVI